MKNVLEPVLRFKTTMTTSPSSAKFTTNHKNSRGYPFKLCQVQSTQNILAKAISTKKHKSLKNSLLIISAVCKGVILCPGAKNLNALISKIKMHPMLRYVDDYPPGKDRKGHEQILAEQQKQLEKLKKELKERESVEKFPKYTPKSK